MTTELESQPYKLMDETVTDLEILKQSYDVLKKIEQESLTSKLKDDSITFDELKKYIKIRDSV